MSKREGSPSSNTNLPGTPTKKSKVHMNEDATMELDQTQEIIPVAGPSGTNPGPSNTNPRKRYSPMPSLYCFGRNERPTHSVNPEYVNPSTTTFCGTKTHRSRAESRNLMLPSHKTDASLSNVNEDMATNQIGQPLGATDSTDSMDVDELMVKKVESSSSVEREEKSNRLDWTGSRI